MGCSAKDKKERCTMNALKILLDIRTAFELEAKHVPHAVFFSSDRKGELKKSLCKYGASEEEAESTEGREGLRVCGMRVMVSEPVPPDQVWVFNQVGYRIGTFQMGEANDSARSI